MAGNAPDVRITVDAKSFDRMMREYLKHTSKTTTEAVNGKMKDVLIKSQNLTPVADPAAIESNLRRCPASITQYANFKWPDGWTRAQWEQMRTRIIRQRRAWVKYMRAGFSKASRLFPKTKASRARGVNMPFKKFNSVVASGKKAGITQAKKEASATISWGSQIGEAREKQKIAEKAMKKAVALVFIDMVGYLVGKNNKFAKKWS